MQPGPPCRRRAGPFADAPIESLLLRTDDLTKGWLLALLEDAPLDDAPAILAAQLARDGPRVCAAVIRALASDADLRRLEAGGALEQLVSRSGSFAGVHEVDSISHAVDALAGVIWSAVRDELVRPDADQVSHLAERLGLVIELVRGAALRHSAEGLPGVPRAAPQGPAAADPDSGSPWVVSMPDSGAGSLGDPTPDALGVPGMPEPNTRAGPSPIAVSRPAAAGRLASPPRSPGGSPPDPLWMGALDDEIRRATQSGTPLSLLLVELEVNLGVAVFGEDGRDGDGLIQAAEQGVYAAVASGIEIADAAGQESRDPSREPRP